MPEYGIDIKIDAAKAKSDLKRFQEGLRATEDQTKELRRETFKAFTQAEKALSRENRILKMNRKDRQIAIQLRRMEFNTLQGFNKAQREILRNQLRANQALRVQNSVLRQITGPAEDYRQKMAALNILQKQGRITAKQYSMASERLRRDFDRLSKQATTTGNTLTRLFTLAGAGFGVRGLGRMIDTYTRLQNRIRVVTEGQRELESVTGQLFDIARKTRSSFEATTTIYTRLALASENLGITHEQTARFTELLNKATLISGASSNEARYGIIQLSQALAAGALRGDELRSVLEQMPVVAGVIADALGITRGELRKLGAEGKITADAIVKAMLNAGEDIDERFGKTIPTVAQGFTILGDSVTQAVGKLDKALGVSRRLAKMLIGLADNAEQLISVLSKLAFVIGTILAGRAIWKLIQALRLLNATTKANLLFATAAVGGTAAVEIINKIYGSTKKLTAAQLENKRANEALAAELERQQKIADQIAAANARWERDAGKLTKAFIAQHKEMAKAVGFERRYLYASDRARAVHSAGLKKELEIRKEFDDLRLNKPEMFKKLLNAQVIEAKQLVRKEIALKSLRETYLNIRSPIFDFQEQVRNLSILLRRGRISFEEFRKGIAATEIGGQFESLVRKVAPAVKTVAQATKEVNDEFDELNDQLLTYVSTVEDDVFRVDKATEGLFRRRKEQLEEIQQPYKKYIDNLKWENYLLTLNATERKVAVGLAEAEKKAKVVAGKDQRDALEAQIRENEYLTQRREILKSLRGPLEEYLRLRQNLIRLVEEGEVGPRTARGMLEESAFGQQLGLAPEDPMQREQEAYQRRLEQARMFYAQNGEMLNEYLTLTENAYREHQMNIMQIEADRSKMLLQMGTNLFGSLAELTRTFAGEQSGIYRSMFAITKAFAIGEASVMAGLAISNAIASAPWPANEAAIAEAVAATSAVISQIASAVPGFQTGGEFRVGGAGDADSQMVMFKASPNETVSVRTPSQQRTEEREKQAPAGQPEINIANIVSPDMIEDYFRDAQGQKAFINIIRRNSGAIRGILGGRRS